MVNVNDVVEFQVPENYPQSIECTFNLNQKVKRGRITSFYSNTIVLVALDTTCPGCHEQCSSVIMETRALKLIDKGETDERH